MDKPTIKLISSASHSSKALVLIQGAWSQDNDPGPVWVRRLRDLGWKDAIYELWWDSSELIIDPEYEPAVVWKHVKDRADKVGKDYFSDLICSIPQKEISLIAYSAGVRIVYYGLKKWSGHGSYFQDAILLAGAIRRDENWGKAAFHLDGNLINIYNKEDPKLKYYKLRAWGNSPCGLKQIEEPHRQIINIDATSAIGKTHDVDAYLSFLPEVVRRGYWRP